MTYASIILPYEYKKSKLNDNPKTTQDLKGKLKSAMQKSGAAIKNAIKNPGATFKTLGKYLQDNEDKILNKFSGIALAQMLASGKVTNEDALNYLFLGFAPALDQQAIAMGYSGATQMKDAIKNGTINVGSFISGFTKVQKSIVDFKNAQKNKEKQKDYKILDVDAVFNHGEQYQSESPDRRTETRNSYQDVLHNMPEIFSLECSFSDLKHKGEMTSNQFKGYLKQLRESKTPFGMVFKDGETDIDKYTNVVLQDFSPSVLGTRSGIDYTLELKQIHIGSVELTPITIEPLDISIYPEKDNNGGVGAGLGNVNIPNMVNNPATSDTKLTPNKKQSMWAYTTDLGGGNAAKGALKLMGFGDNENL